MAEKYDNTGRSADEAYSIEQKAGQPVAIDPSQLRAKAMQKHVALDGAAADSFAMEQADNEDARRAYQIMEESGGLSLADLMEDLSPTEFRDNEMKVSRQDMARMKRAAGAGLNQAVQQVGRDLVQEAYTDFPGESSMMAESMAGSPDPADGDWTTVQRAAKLKGGKMVPVWLVVNEATGMKIDKPFRIQPPAERIATILNITGNANDPRIKQIQEDYDEHVRLMKGIRQCRQYIKEGKDEYRGRLQSLQVKLEGVNVKLGI